METESTFNPGKWQITGNKNAGYGLAQWSPAEDFFAWAEKNGLDPEDIDTQLEYMHLEEFGMVHRWQASRHEKEISFEKFIQSDMPETELAKIFMLCYERPKDKSEKNQNDRAVQAEDWKEIFGIIYNMED